MAKRFEISKRNGDVFKRSMGPAELKAAGALAEAVDGAAVGAVFVFSAPGAGGAPVELLAKRLADSSLVRVGIAVWVDVDPDSMGAGIIGGPSSSVDLDLSADNPGDVAFIAGGVAREVFGLVDAACIQGAIVGRAKLARASCGVMSAHKVAGPLFPDAV
jgi:hypothetical protein